MLLRDWGVRHQWVAVRTVEVGLGDGPHDVAAGGRRVVDRHGCGWWGREEGHGLEGTGGQVHHDIRVHAPLWSRIKERRKGSGDGWLSEGRMAKLAGWYIGQYRESVLFEVEVSPRVCRAWKESEWYLNDGALQRAEPEHLSAG